MKDTTRRQVVNMIVDLLLEGPHHSVLRKIEGIAHNDASFEITIRERKNRYTNFRVTISEPESFDLEEEDD